MLKLMRVKIRTHKIKILFFLQALSLSACTTIHVNPPLPIAVSPRMGVAGKYSGQIGGDPAIDVLADGMESRPPNITTAVSSGYTMNQTIEGGQSRSFWELTGGAYPGVELKSIGIYGQAKISLLGPRGIWNSSDLHFSIFGKIGYQRATSSGDQKVVFGSGGYPWTGIVTTKFFTGGISVGKSFGDWLIYLGGAYMDFPVTVASEQGRADDNSDPGGSYSKNLNGISWTTGLGIEHGLGERALLGLTVHYGYYEFNGNRDYIAPASLYIRLLTL